MHNTVATFGEIMLRLSTPRNERFTQAQSFEASFGGGEGNVAVSLAQFGTPSRFVTRLPRNEIGNGCRSFLRGMDVDTSCIVRGGERMGVYYLETGAAQRPSAVIYDRSHSSFSTIEPGMIDWDRAFDGVSWFHWTGITPAVSPGAAQVCREAITAAKKRGITISCDLNFRKNLWKWGKSAGEVMPELVSFCDVAVGNEEDAQKVFGIASSGSDITKGELDTEGYRDVCRRLSDRFPNLTSIAITLRGSLSASHNSWSGLLWHKKTMYDAPVYHIHPIVDRVGGGDSFCAGLIYGLRTFDNPEQALQFAVAASCLKHTVHGDCNLVSVEDVTRLMDGDGSGRVRR